MGKPGDIEYLAGPRSAFLDFIAANMPRLQGGQADKVEAHLPGGQIKIYWCGNVIRIDIKPIGPRI